MAGGMSEGSGDEQDFDLNLAPIIDCFVVLITYMLVSASFITIDSMEVNVAATTTTPQTSEQTPHASVSIEISSAHTVDFKVSDRQPAHFAIAAAGGDWDLQAMDKTAKKVLQKWPTIKEINVKAGDDIEYKEIIKVVETLKGSFPAVYLGE